MRIGGVDGRDPDRRIEGGSAVLELSAEDGAGRLRAVIGGAIALAATFLIGRLLGTSGIA